MSDIDTAIRDRIQASQAILITAHVRPDGDAIGSMLGLGLSLRAAEKTVVMALVDGVPGSFKHLEGSADVLTAPQGAFDLCIVVDCAERKRLGIPFETLGQVDINIDHHITNDLFGKLNLIEVEQVATAALLADHLPAWGLPVTRPVADALLTGIITDTLGFRTSNMNPHVMRQAAFLMESGANLPDLYMRGLVLRSFSATRYWGEGLSRLERSNGIVWATLTLEDRKTAGYGGNDDADLINIVSAIDESSVAIMFTEQRNTRVKVSWRAQKPGVDVSKIALAFGGGGHAAAAGADIVGTLDEVRERVLDITRQALVF